MKNFAIIGAVIVAILVLMFVFRPQPDQSLNPGTVTTVASGLHVPWSVAFLPNGDMFTTERNGTLRVFGESKMNTMLPGVIETGEGGLLGIAVHPDHLSNRFIYLYYTTKSKGQTINRVVRYFFEGIQMRRDKIIVDNIPGGTNHNGGRIAFGPDKMLYITTGDAGDENLAQNTDSLAGKILRVHDDGTIPADNPFGTAVYSYGHRNPQGLAWDEEGNLWETEHGRSGLQSGFDEINLIKKGANYGWPKIQGDETAEGMEKPILHSGATETWAPSDVAFKEGKLYFAGLRGEALYSVEVLGSGKLGDLTTYFKGQYGRLRGVTLSKKGELYVTTSNKDGRGTPKEGDDRILKLSL